MSTTEPEALRLAELLEGGSNQYRSEAAAELRRQHAEIAHADRYAEQMGRELSKATAEIADLRARLASIAGGRGCATADRPRSRRMARRRRPCDVVGMVRARMGWRGPVVRDAPR